MPEYTDYCVCFYDEADKNVCFYDEIKDSFISKRKVDSIEEAEMIMKSWVDNAPEHVICQQLEQQFDDMKSIRKNSPKRGR